MFTLIVLLAYCGFLCFYLISKKVKGIVQNTFFARLSTNEFSTKLSGAALLIFGLAASIYVYGISTGIVVYCMVISVVPCVIILLRPLGYLKTGNAISFFLLSFLLELLF